MKRSIIVSLIAFLVTIGAGIGLFHLLSNKADTADSQTATPAADAPATTPSTTSTKESTTTPAEEKPAATGEASTEPNKDPQQKSTDNATAENDTRPDTKTGEDNSTADTTTDSTPAADEPTPEPPPVLPEAPAEARDPGHGLALVTSAVLGGERVSETLELLVSSGRMAADLVAPLSEWAKTHRIGKVVEIATVHHPDSTKTKRYRLISADGSGDLLLDIHAARDGSVRIEKATAVPSDPSDIGSADDHLCVAESFITAMKQGDMGKARNMVVDTEISNATIAGICMLFDEGEFALSEHSPLRGTFANEQHAGYLAYVYANTGEEKRKPCYIGLEMSHTDKGWRVRQVALDTLLQHYEQSAHAEGGRYFPIVKNPKGGDSLALFFAFNEAELTPRSLRQLRIVADMLKASQGSLNISGHTDDVGSAAYNLKLSERRAAAVKEALVSYGVEASQITTHGLGKSQPRRTYNTDDSESEIDYIRGENRRAEIYLDFES